jgi:hypothetical protein
LGSTFANIKKSPWKTANPGAHRKQNVGQVGCGLCDRAAVGKLSNRELELADKHSSLPAVQGFVVAATTVAWSHTKTAKTRAKAIKRYE